MRYRLLYIVILVACACANSAAQPFNRKLSLAPNDQGEPYIAVDPQNPYRQICVWNDNRDGFSKAGFAFTTTAWTTNPYTTVLDPPSDQDPQRRIRFGIGMVPDLPQRTISGLPSRQQDRAT